MQLRSLFLGVIILYLLSSCSITIPKMATEVPLGPSVGVSTCTCYFGVFCQDADISVRNAASNGNIVKISSIDIESNTIFLGIIKKYSTIVTGYTKDQLSAEESKKDVLPLEVQKQVSYDSNSLKNSPIHSESVQKIEKLEVDKVVSAQEAPAPVVVDQTKKITAAERVKIAEEQLRSIEDKQNKNQNVVTKSDNQTKNTKISNANNSVKEIDFLASTPQIRIKGSSLTDLSNKLKSISEGIMKNGDLYPIDIIFDSKRNTFSCNFINKKSSLIKLGIYFGPKNTGCESCDNVIIKNPGSEILMDEIIGNLIIQVIAIKGI